MNSIHWGQTESTPGSAPPHPMILGANQPAQFYRGGSAIAALRGADDDKDFGPEDWVASTTNRFGHAESGLTRLPDGRLLRDVVEANPYAWLGENHVKSYGTSTALLVKLLDAGQRLPVHCHPSDDFAHTHFDSRFGKSEAWIVVGTNGSAPTVYLGFREDVDESTVNKWVSTQDGHAMLDALNPIQVHAGDSVFVPAGTPHAIGEGVFVVELQQPTDFSITLEWKGFLQEEANGHLGIGFETALDCLDRTGWDQARTSSVIRRTGWRDDPVINVLTEKAAPFFRADRVHPREATLLPQSFGVLVALDGAGTLQTHDDERLDIQRGDTVVVPYSAGTTRLAGEIVALHCRPPEGTGV